MVEQYQLVSWIEGLLEGAFLLETTALLLTYRHRKWRSARLSFASGEKKKKWEHPESLRYPSYGESTTIMTVESIEVLSMSTCLV